MVIERKQAANRTQDRAVRQLADGWLRLQSRCAGWLNRKVNPLPKPAKLVFFLLFAALASGYSLYHLMEGVSANPKTMLSVVGLERTAPVRRFPNQHLQKEAGDSILTAETYQRIRRFRRHMDSLANNPTGRRMFDSITAARPGLLDSVLFVERMHRMQTRLQTQPETFNQPAK